MFYIGICDDEKMQRQRMKKMCNQFFMGSIYEYTCIEFESGEEVLDYNGENLHLLFLDIEMGEVGGLEVLRVIEGSDKVWRIVFVSSHEEFVWDVFSIKTLDFGRKPVSYSQVERWLGILIRENEENVIIEFGTGQDTFHLSLSQIFYFEAAGNFTYLKSKKDKRLVGGHLKIWHERMGEENFVRTHKSYLINIMNIKQIYNDHIIMLNGEKIALGRKYVKEVREKYRLFVQRQVRGRMAK